jgi:hypothetical protein
MKPDEDMPQIQWLQLVLDIVLVLRHVLYSWY